MLKHYPCTNQNVRVKKVLECRSRLCYRTGRLAQAWPDSELAVKKTLATIEDAKDMLDAGATTESVPPKYPQPEVVTTIAPPKKKGENPSKTLEPQRLIGEVLGDEEDGATSANAGAKQVVAAHRIPEAQVLGLPREPWEDLEPIFWSRLVSEQVMHAHIMHQESTDHVQVVRAEVAEPMVWHARALAEQRVGSLILVPWVKAEPVYCEKNDKGEEEVCVKRTPGLHPSLLGFEVVQVMAEGMDQHRFALTSPVNGPVKADAKAPAPLWCVISVAEPGEANMAYRECRLETSAPAIMVQGQRKHESNKAGKTKIVTKFRVLTNICKIERGNVLTVCPEEKQTIASTPPPAAPATKRPRKGA